jgi:hypothetical protein
MNAFILGYPYFNGPIIHVANLVETRHQFFNWIKGKQDLSSCFPLFQLKAN